MGPLICDKCGTEILPGSQVTIVTAEDDDPRIVLDGDALIAHVECPKED